MKRKEYMRIELENFPEDVIEHYILRDIEKDDKVYVEISKGVYGLPQAGIAFPQAENAEGWDLIIRTRFSSISKGGECANRKRERTQRVDAKKIERGRAVVAAATSKGCDDPTGTGTPQYWGPQRTQTDADAHPPVNDRRRRSCTP